MKRFGGDKKYLYWGLTAFAVIAASICFYLLLSRWAGVARAGVGPACPGVVLLSMVSSLSDGHRGHGEDGRRAGGGPDALRRAASAARLSVPGLSAQQTGQTRWEVTGSVVGLRAAAVAAAVAAATASTAVAAAVGAATA